MNDPELSSDDYRFLAALPEREQKLIVDLIRHFDATFADQREPGARGRPCFIAELDDEEREE